MGVLIIKGDTDILKAIAKRSRLQIKKYNLSASITEEELNEDENSKLKASEIVELINKAETLEALKEFESYKQKTVKAAYDKKLKELSK